MPINAHPDYLAAEGKFFSAKTPEEQLVALEEMISKCPSHKGAEKLRAQLKIRYKKLKEKISRGKKARGAGKIGIKKSEMQAVIVGKTNSGKSSLISLLTNACPKISSNSFETKTPQVGMMNYADTQIQIIENPALDSEFYDRGISNSAEVLLILTTKLDDIPLIQSKINNPSAKQIIVFNKVDLLEQDAKRKLDATLKSKRYDYVLISTKTEENIEDLKGKIFQSFKRIRIYTKDPNKKEPDKTKPIILMPESTIRDAAEKILHGFSDKVKETKLWGPSSKFPGQKVGLNHVLKDLDVVEFKTS